MKITFNMKKNIDIKWSLWYDLIQAAVFGIYTTFVSESTLDESPMAYRGIEKSLDVTDPTAEVAGLRSPVYNFKASKAAVDEESMDGRD